MMRRWDRQRKVHLEGFTLFELLVVTVILGILAIVSTTMFSMFRGKSQTAAGIQSGQVIRTALMTYASEQPSGSYPAAITTYDDLVALINNNGGKLPDSEQEAGFTLLSYVSNGADSNGNYTHYTLRIGVIGVRVHQKGWCVVITPANVVPCPSS